MMSKKRIFAITTVILFVTPIVGFIQFEVLDTKDTPQYLLDAGYTLYCDERFLQVPTNCRLENEQREQITDEIIIRDMIRGRPRLHMVHVGGAQPTVINLYRVD